jgi:hypothetical protein
MILELGNNDYEGFNIKIEQDCYHEDGPREWDNLGEMVCFHNRYVLGDKHNFSDPEEFSDYIKDQKVVILPLYLYDHSGITISTGPFSCPWDSGQVGYIYVTYEKIRKEYGIQRVTKQWIKKIESYLEGEVKTYDQHLTGDVYGYTIEDENGDLVDSCWGFYGHDFTDMFESNIKPEIDYLLDQTRIDHQDMTKIFIKNRVPLEIRANA